MKSIAQQRPAGSCYDINIAKRATMEEGKDRLFGVGNQNLMQPKQDNFRTGKKVN